MPIVPVGRRARSNARAAVGGGGSALCLFVAACLGCLVWTFSNPILAAPDEPANIVKAAASADLQWIGTPHTAGFEREPTRRRTWYQQVSRDFELSPQLAAPPTGTCFAFTPMPASCQHLGGPPPGSDAHLPLVTPQGAYPPFVYVFPGAGLLLGGSLRSAVWLGRLGAALAALMLLLLAGWGLLGARPRHQAEATGPDMPAQRAVRLAGLAVAVSPMALFLSSTITTNGIEVMAGLATLCLGLRASASAVSVRGGVVLTDAFSPVTWWLLGGASALLVLSRILDPLYLLVISLVVVLGRRPATAARRTGDQRSARRHLVGVLDLVVGAVAVSVAWDLSVMPHPATDYPLALASVGDVWRSIPEQSRQLVGIFGWLDSPLPGPVYVCYLVAVTLLVVLALAGGTARERLALCALIGATLAADLGVGTLVLRQIDFGMQGRYVLVLATAVPVFAAEVIGRHVPAARWRLVAGTAAVLIAGVAVAHGVALFANLHRYAVGSRAPLWSIWRSTWQAPGGNGVWVAAAGLLALLGVLAAVLLLRSVSPAGVTRAPSAGG